MKFKPVQEAMRWMRTACCWTTEKQKSTTCTNLHVEIQLFQVRPEMHCTKFSQERRRIYILLWRSAAALPQNSCPLPPRPIFAGNAAEAVATSNGSQDSFRWKKHSWNSCVRLLSFTCLRIVAERELQASWSSLACQENTHAGSPPPDLQIACSTSSTSHLRAHKALAGPRNRGIALLNAWQVIHWAVLAIIFAHRSSNDFNAPVVAFICAYLQVGNTSSNLGRWDWWQLDYTLSMWKAVLTGVSMQHVHHPSSVTWTC